MIYLDTHVIIWLYEGLLDKFTAKAKDYLGNHELIISPMVYLEIQYLYEIKRVKLGAAKIIDYLVTKLGLTVSNESFMQITQIASAMNWTRDPFDRIIVANAKMHEALLLTKDESIQRHYKHAIW